MKKLILLLLTGTLIASCAPGGLQEGTYKAEYKHFDSHSWKPIMSIVIKGGKVASVVYKELNHNNEIKAESEGYAAAMKKKSGMVPAVAEEQLISGLLSTQKAPVDTVTGATSLSKKFNTLTEALLKCAAAGDTKPLYLEMNGTYTASEKKLTPEGFKGEVKVTFKAGKIVKAEYYEIDGDKNKNPEGREIRTALAKELVTVQTPVDLKGETPGELTRFKSLVKQIFTQRGMK